MNPIWYLAEASPTAQPVRFFFDDREWLLWPVNTVPIALQLERWVVQFAARNVEMLKPDADNEDPAAWRIYHERTKAFQDGLERGSYGALSRAWSEIINLSDAGFAEGLHQCIAFKETEWTREKTARLFNNPATRAAMDDLWTALNFPKKKGSPPQANQNQTAPPATGSPSTGETFSVESSAPASSPPAKSSS